MEFIIDCSIVIAWCFEDKTTAAIQDLRWRAKNGGAVAPPLWRYEVTNALLQAQKRRRIAPAEANEHIAVLALFPVEIDARCDPDIQKAILSLARAHDLTAYDAAYLELALRRGIPLATQDAALHEAAGKIGIGTLLE